MTTSDERNAGIFAWQLFSSHHSQAQPAYELPRIQHSDRDADLNDPS